MKTKVLDLASRLGWEMEGGYHDKGSIHLTLSNDNSYYLVLLDIEKDGTVHIAHMLNEPEQDDLDNRTYPSDAPHRLELIANYLKRLV